MLDQLCGRESHYEDRLGRLGPGDFYDPATHGAAHPTAVAREAFFELLRRVRPETLEGLPDYESVEDWATRWHISVPWVCEVARATLRYASFLGKVFSDASTSKPISQPLLADGFLFPAYGSDDPDDPGAQHKAPPLGVEPPNLSTGAWQPTATRWRDFEISSVRGVLLQHFLGPDWE